VTAILAPTLAERAPGLRRAQVLRAVGAAVLAVAVTASLGSISAEPTADRAGSLAPSASLAALDPAIPTGTETVSVVVQGHADLDPAALASAIARLRRRTPAGRLPLPA
jgi:hypothetical protein